MNDENSGFSRSDKFKSILLQPNVDIIQLKKLAWNGIPNEFRAEIWQILLGLLPVNSERRKSTLERKRKEYIENATTLFAKGVEGLDHTTYHQIHIDMPRTNPEVELFQRKVIQEALERILYCWAIRHPASGYYFSSYNGRKPFEIDEFQLQNVEADSYWCLNKLLDGIQDNYTFSQPGIQRQVQKLKELMLRIDSKAKNA
ncbi:Rab-GTPase-TBC domain-containing protein [Rozella allomycis CSF55]|uniref:Rab-GTPase-TBC domain-containing protein n=1 Tax=Rozella allomycis (strain CSF55) TaxID=988480 RepID=A0A075B3V6_ROZAC|nr:Rab-GTPase-TBC domain-containing protein [Rozella allomycis CSF55]|eukprot:EPZ35608.1 Rab-GTPase-TBC domain-containing protein [Rozella allomycis CSF55]